VTVLGFTGHQRLSREAWSWAEGALRSLIHVLHPSKGLSSLAVGTDQLFARVVLDLECDLVVVRPFPDYERTFEASDLVEYRRLVANALEVVDLPWAGTDEQSYMNAGSWIVAHCDQLVAVWNGQQAAGLGGTGDVVTLARESGVRVWHLDTTRMHTTKLEPLLS
jgi:hypothetical protein